MTELQNLEYFVPLSVGILSSFGHCIGMCGPIQLAIQSKVRGHVPLMIFHAGRTSSYIVLGLLTGALGMMIHGSNHPSLMVAAKIMIIILFLVLAVIFWGVGTASLEKMISKLIPTEWVLEKILKSVQRNLYLAGIFTGLLPCPTTYAVLGWIISLGSPLKGGIGMALLGLATVPSFILIWYSLGWKKLWSAPVMYKFLSLLFLGLAIWKIYQLVNMDSTPHMCH
jgi:sulfite exporter TauE/SafE